MYWAGKYLCSGQFDSIGNQFTVDSYSANVWEDVELIIDSYPFCTSFQISSMNKKSRSKIPLKPKAPFEWVFMDIVPSTASKSLTNETTFSNCLLIDDAYYQIPKLYGMENITTAEVMEKLDMFQSRFGKIDQFGWWDLERISSNADTQFTSTEFKDECQTRGFCLTLAAPEHQEMNRHPGALGTGALGREL